MRSLDSIPFVGIGSPTRSTTLPLRRWIVPIGSSSRMPTMATGTTGTPALIATYAGPSLNSRSPTAERPPSGKFITETPRPLMMRAASIMLFNEARGLERSTGMCPARSRCVPRKGMRKRLFLAKNRNCCGSEASSAGMSM